MTNLPARPSEEQEAAKARLFSSCLEQATYETSTEIRWYTFQWPTSVGKITMQSEFPKLHGDRREDALFRQVEQAGKEPSICNMWLVGRQLVDAHSICYLFLLCFPNMVIYKYCAALKILKCPRLPCAMLGLLGNWRHLTSGKQPARAKPLGLSPLRVGQKYLDRSKWASNGRPQMLPKSLPNVRLGSIGM